MPYRRAPKYRRETAVLNYVTHQLYDIITIPNDVPISVNAFTEKKPRHLCNLHECLPAPYTFDAFSISVHSMIPDINTKALEMLWSCQLHLFLSGELCFEGLVRLAWDKQCNLSLEGDPLHIPSKMKIHAKLFGRYKLPTIEKIVVGLHGVYGKP